MRRDEIISGLEREVKSIRKEPQGKMLGIFMTVDEAEDIITLLKEQDNCENCTIAIEDRQPVVRCKECKYCFAEGFVHEHNICDKHEEIQGQPDDWFCAYGERKSAE